MHSASPASVQATHPAWLSHSNENIPLLDHEERVSGMHERELLPQQAIPRSLWPTYSSPLPSNGSVPPPCGDVTPGLEGASNVHEPVTRTEQGLPSHPPYPPPFARDSGCSENSPAKRHSKLALELTEEMNNNVCDRTNQDVSTASHPPTSVSQSSPPPQPANDDVASISAGCLKSALKVAEERWSSVHVHVRTLPKRGISHPLHHSVKAPKISRFDFTGHFSVSTLTSIWSLT